MGKSARYQTKKSKNKNISNYWSGATSRPFSKGGLEGMSKLNNFHNSSISQGGDLEC